MVSAGISSNAISKVSSEVKTSKSTNSNTAETDFTKVLEKQSEVKTSVSNDKKNNNLAKNDNVKEIIQKNFSDSNSKEKKITSNDNEEDNLLENANALYQNIINVIAENIGVEPEKVVDAISDIGIQPEEMLDTSVINDIVTDLTGMENIMDILTDDELSVAIKNIYAEIGELEESFSENFGIDRAELVEILENVDVIQDMGDNANNNVVVNEQKTDYTTEISGDEAGTANVDITETSTNSNEIKNDVKGDNSNSEGYHENSNYESSGNEMISVLDGIREAVVQDIQGEDNGLADRIIKQITDDIKMYANQNTTSLEIQLEPESLGKVSLTVASKSGSVTAQLMVQNEVAKEAIESQISTLKETMNNQGIKIEAIEVTVASREFEENLDKQNNNSEHQEQRNRRHLSDEELAEINGITVSEDKIREEIMKEMGNTVSYSA
jgi:flagellar hook-length control protein FliK